MNPPSPPIVSKPSLWQELRNAIRGTEVDYTKIDLRRAIFLLGVPMILELVMESLSFSTKKTPGQRLGQPYGVGVLGY